MVEGSSPPKVGGDEEAQPLLIPSTSRTRVKDVHHSVHRGYKLLGALIFLTMTVLLIALQGDKIASANVDMDIQLFATKDNQYIPLQCPGLEIMSGAVDPRYEGSNMFDLTQLLLLAE